MPEHILFISSWYPTPEKKSHGIFFKRHAEAAALINDISSIHISSGISNAVRIENENNVLTISGTYKKVRNHIPVVSSIQKLWRSLCCFKQAYQVLLKHKPKPKLVLLNVIFPAGIFALWLYYLKNIPFLIQEQWSGYYPEDGNYKGFITKIITKQCAKKAKAILVVSNKLEQSMKAHHLLNNYIHIGNAVDTALFVPLVRLEKKAFKFVHVSTVNDKEKNISGIIEAAAILTAKNSSFQIDIIGDGPERKRFEEKAKSLNLLSTIINFHGFKAPEEVAKLMALGNCFLLNSNYEGLPCVLLEAMSCGIPVISTRVGAVPEIIDATQGILIDANNAEELVMAMEKMITHHHAFNAAEIRNRVVNKFSYPALAKDFDAIFRTVLKA